MNKNSFYLICSILLSFFFVSCATLPGGKKDSQKFSYTYKTVEVSEESEYLSTKIKYPQFTDFPDLNKRIENTILSNWKTFKTYSKSEWKSIVDLNNRGTSKLPPFEYLVTFDVSGNKNIISILLNTYVFNGGAHGNTSLTSLNYDTVNNKYINILQATGMNYNEISSVCRNTLYKRLIEDNKTALQPAQEDSMREMINTGAFPQAGNFEIFTVDGNKVYALFEPYSVAPYAYGIQKVQVK